MTVDPWLPVGFELESGVKAGRVLYSGDDWQIIDVHSQGRALLMQGKAARFWREEGLLEEREVRLIDFGDVRLGVVFSEGKFTLAPLKKCNSPRDRLEALSFATSLKQSRARRRKGSFEDAIYVEKLSRLLPTGEATADDELVLGSWLTGGLRVSIVPVSNIRNLLSWMPVEHLVDVIRAAGLEPAGVVLDGGTEQIKALDRATGGAKAAGGRLRLPGRAALEEFFNDHVIDIVQNKDRYAALGIGNPAGIILEGPTGCGKTVAVERLIAHLGWPHFAVDASSVASPYIHETSRKVAQLFRAAIDAAPSVVVIDEMDAFLSERDAGGGQHRVEEIAEFLRIIPEAIKAGVLIVGMTNRLDAIDPAILRRGRFDQIVSVGHAGEAEMLDFLRTLTEDVPLAESVSLGRYAETLAGRPLSDTAYLVREASRLAARARLDFVDDKSFAKALHALTTGAVKKRRPGFV